MRVPSEFICKICKRVFCCAECRHKHEIKTHAIVVRVPVVTTNTMEMDSGSQSCEETANSQTIYLFCPICETKPLMLQQEMYSEMLKHIEQNHLPLRCQKCRKVYTSIDDLREFSKCLYASNSCNGSDKCSTDCNQSCETDTSKKTVTKASSRTTISTQTSPMRNADFNDSNLTPISIINLRWKAKSKITQEEFISDSVSSIRNISSISNCSIRRSIGVVPGPKGNLVRSTSTPVNAELIFAKPREQTFNASGGHVSSIYNSGCESDISPAVPNPPNGTPPKQPLDNINRYRKVTSRAKISAVTPLRHVMSKSIQKAFAEHGIPSVSARAAAYNRKKMFDSNDSTSTVEPPSASNGAMDLRLSPVVRRTQSEIYDSSKSETSAPLPLENNNSVKLHHEILLSSQKLTTESIVITRTQHLASIASSSNNSLKPNSSSSSSNTTNQSATSNGNSVYKTCRSVEIITSTELSEVNIQQNAYSIEESVDELRPLQPLAQSSGYNMAPITPITRIPGATINKKLIKFETPKVDITKDKCKSTQHSSPGNDAFFTPSATPNRKKSFQSDSSEKKESSGVDRKKIVPRNLSGGYSPQKRPSLRDYTQTAAFNRIQDVTEHIDVDYDDEVFLPEEGVGEALATTHEQKNSQGAGRLWSLMSSVMRMPSWKKEDTADMMPDIKSNSIIKRCASIAGSLVRTKPLIEDDQLKPLKRKRTYTTNENQSAYLSQLNCTEISPNADYSTSSKRFRIHARKPIERMRLN